MKSVQLCFICTFKVLLSLFREHLVPSFFGTIFKIFKTVFMGKFTPKGLSGLVGTVVAYNMRGKNFLRSRPDTTHRKKSDPPIPTRAVFGLVSRFGSAMT